MSSGVSAVDQVFSNHLIVEKIFSSIVHGSQNIGELKGIVRQSTINKTVNSAMISLFRKFYRKVDIHLIHRESRAIQIGSQYLLMDLNGHIMTLYDFENIGKYLRKFADLKTEELRIGGNWCNKQNCSKIGQKILHDEIKLWIAPSYLKVIIGMYFLCEEGCDWCLEMTKMAQRVGPIQLTFFDEKDHFEFESVRLTEQSLRRYGIKCAEKSKDYVECMRNLENMISENITCHNLIIELMDDACFPHKKAPFGSLPQEVVERVLSAWRVKKLTIEYIPTIREHYCRMRRDIPRFFQLIDIQLPNTNVLKSKYLLEELELDTTAIEPLSLGYTASEVQQKIDDYVGSMKKLFLSKKTKVTMFFDFFSTESEKFIEDVGNVISQLECISGVEIHVTLEMDAYRAGSNFGKLHKISEVGKYNWILEDGVNDPSLGPKNTIFTFHNAQNTKTITAILWA